MEHIEWLLGLVGFSTLDLIAVVLLVFICTARGWKLWVMSLAFLMCAKFDAILLMMILALFVAIILDTWNRIESLILQ